MRLVLGSRGAGARGGARSPRGDGQPGDRARHGPVRRLGDDASGAGGGRPAGGLRRADRGGHVRRRRDDVRGLRGARREGFAGSRRRGRGQRQPGDRARSRPLRGWDRRRGVVPGGPRDGLRRGRGRGGREHGGRRARVARARPPEASSAPAVGGWAVAAALPDGDGADGDPRRDGVRGRADPDADALASGVRAGDGGPVRAGLAVLPLRVGGGTARLTRHEHPRGAGHVGRLRVLGRGDVPAQHLADGCGPRVLRGVSDDHHADPARQVVRGARQGPDVGCGPGAAGPQSRDRARCPRWTGSRGAHR